MKKNKIVLLAIEKGSNRKALTETIYSIEGEEEIPIRSDLFMLLTKARDEAHRFAIRANRAANDKSIKSSKLDTIAGIGPKRRILLFKKFKSLKGIINAPSDRLMGVRGITSDIVKEIKNLNL